VKLSCRSLSPVQTGFWFVIFLISAKFAQLFFARPDESLWNLPAASVKDVVFAALVVLIWAAAARAFVRRPAIVRVVRGAMLGFTTLCIVYSVVNFQVCQFFSRPLSFDLLRLVHDAAAARSSITERISIWALIMLFAGPTTFLVLTLSTDFRPRYRALAVAAVGAWLVIGVIQHKLGSNPLNNPRLALNPHMELARSTAVGIVGPHLTFPTDFPPRYLADFRPYKERGEPPGSYFEVPASRRPRNVIVVVMESVGTKYMTLYGSPFQSTPNLATESSNALVFDNFYAQASYTYLSFRALNFSMYPGLPWSYPPWSGRKLPPSLGALLRRRGFNTVYLHSGDLDWGQERWLLQNDGYSDTEGYAELGCNKISSWGTEDRCLIDRLIQWVDEQHGHPFFAFCWTDQTHDPYRLGPGVVPIDFVPDEKSHPLAKDLSSYLNVVHETDRQLGRLFAALRKRNLANDTLVVVTGDHGEAFRDPHEQRGHGMSVYEEEVHVPLMLWNPRLFALGRRYEPVGQHVDLVPTIADILGVDPAGEWQGHSMFDPARPTDAFFLTNSGDYLFAVRDGKWKYIFDATGGPDMLFDLGRDRDERCNLAAQQPELCELMRKKIAAFEFFEDKYLRGQTP